MEKPKRIEPGTVQQQSCGVHGNYDARFEVLAPGGRYLLPAYGWSHCPKCKQDWEERNQKEWERFAGTHPGTPGWHEVAGRNINPNDYMGRNVDPYHDNLPDLKH